MPHLPVSFRFLSLAILLPLVFGLSGCQKSGIRTDIDNDAEEFNQAGETTGQMGELKYESAAKVYISLASEYLKVARYKAALQNAKKAIIVDPRSPTAFNVLALTHQQIGEDGLADKYFQKAISLDPKDPYVLNAYGTFLCGKQRYDASDALFLRAVNNPLYPSPWVPLTNAGICAYQKGDADLAETRLRTALLKNSRFPLALLYMAKISFDKGNALSSRAYLQRYSEVAKHGADSLWLGVRTEKSLGNNGQAKSYALLLEAQYPDSHQTRALIESRMNQ